MEMSDLERMDRAIAASLLASLGEDEVPASMIAEARKYLTWKGYTGASLNGLKQTGAKDPRLDLDALFAELDQ